MKKVIAILLCLSMLCGMMSIVSPFSAAGASSDDVPAGTPVSTVEEFLAMNPAGQYYLANDIDFSGKTYTRNLYTKAITGVLDGNGHALLGITVTSTNSDASIFANTMSGTIKNLTIGSPENKAVISSTGTAYSVAAVAGTVTSGATFDNVTIYADVKGDGKTAGFTSYIPSGKITITNCRVYGTITGNPAAGFVTMSHDGQCEIEIKNSVNYADVTGGNKGAGGFYCADSSTGSTRVCDLTVRGCANHGAVTASDWRAGGIVGEFNETAASTLTVDYCYNTGKITMTGSGGYAAGIVGGASYNAPTGKRNISNVYNAGLVQNTANADRAYALCYASNSANVTLTNGTYLIGTPAQGAAYTGVVQASEVKTDDNYILTVLRNYERSAEGYVFVADTAGTNGGYPILNYEATEHENVTAYQCGRKYCADCEIVITNPDEENHTYNEVAKAPSGYMDGYIEAACKYCGEKTIKEGAPSSYHVTPTNGVYKLGSADALIWYATNLNAGLLSGKEALALSADIDMKDKAFTPIGNTAHPFRGSLDGGFYAIQNLTVNSDTVGGLFGNVGMGASISNLELKTPVVKAKGSAGALLGEVVGGATVTVANIVLVEANVTSEAGAAGSMIGSTATASAVTVSEVVSNRATVNGVTAGGLIGNGTGTTMTNSYVNATVKGSTNQNVGFLAYHTGRFTQKNCGYVRNGGAGRTEGSIVTADSFANGELAYRINAWGANFIFGVENGDVTFSDTAVHRVRLGSANVYTDDVLSANGKVALYAGAVDGGVAVAFVLDRNAGVKLMDLEIRVTDGGKTETIKFSDLKLTRYLAVGDNYYTVDMDTVIYTVTLEGVSSSATYSIGTVFSGTATALQ